jgi:uncharacterized membrane-anchored protein YjiN (DUF445 family)
VAIFVGLRVTGETSFAARLLGAACEAAIVGGLADWFAITALFRRPLGLPIPHTALIPSRKNEIGRSLGNFVSEQFLAPDLLLERLRRENRALQVARWLDTPAAADFIAKRVLDVTPLVLNGLDDTEIRKFVRNLASEAIRRVQIVPTVDALLDTFIAAGRHLEIVDLLVDAVRPSLHGLKGPIIERVGEQTGRFFPRYFDRKIGRGIVEGADRWLAALRTFGSSERIECDAWIRLRLAELRASPDYPKLLEQAQMSLVSNPAVLHALSTIWDEIKKELLEDVQSESPRVESVSRDIVRTVGRLLQQMPVIQDYVNAAIEKVLVDYIVPWRAQIGNFIAETIGSWDGPKIADIIEVHVGSDLQYIRINGTLVGALIGSALFLISNALGPS